MMNLKLTICSWILFFMIFSSDTRTVKETYTGPLIDVDNPSHPLKMCAEALDAEFIGWALGTDPCAINITCLSPGNDTLNTLTLPEIPKTGTVCERGFGDEVKACYNKKCIDVVDLSGRHEK